MYVYYSALVFCILSFFDSYSQKLILDGSSNVIKVNKAGSIVEIKYAIDNFDPNCSEINLTISGRNSEAIVKKDYYLVDKFRQKSSQQKFTNSISFPSEKLGSFQLYISDTLSKSIVLDVIYNDDLKTTQSIVLSIVAANGSSTGSATQNNKSSSGGQQGGTISGTTSGNTYESKWRITVNTRTPLVYDAKGHPIRFRKLFWTFLLKRYNVTTLIDDAEETVGIDGIEFSDFDEVNNTVVIKIYTSTENISETYTSSTPVRLNQRNIGEQMLSVQDSTGRKQIKFKDFLTVKKVIDQDLKTFNGNSRSYVSTDDNDDIVLWSLKK